MNDLKFAFRQLLKNPGVSGVAVLTLALGIGANTAIFSMADSVCGDLCLSLILIGWSPWAKATDISANENSGAEIFDDTMKRLEFVNGVSEALNWYVSDRRFQAKLPTFREQLKDLRKAIERFQSAIPDEDTLLDHFLRTTYTGEVFLRDRGKPSRRELTALQDRWQKHIGFPAVQGALNTMLRNIEAAQLLIGNRKPRHHQVKGFVQALAEVWKKATGIRPSNTRDPDSNKQTGQFADFVRATNEILPRTFRIPSLDAAIRTACEAADGS